MRVIAGTARGRQLRSPSSSKIRPTADRVKEALFSILVSIRGTFHGLRVLDICAGTGSLGIESLSRGATHAVFVDQDHDAAALIMTNLKLLGLNKSATLLKMPADRAVAYLSSTGEMTFDLVFFDPPYKLDLPETILPLLGDGRILSEGAIVVVEQARPSTLADTFGLLQKFDARPYGDTTLHFYSPATPQLGSREK